MQKSKGDPIGSILRPFVDKKRVRSRHGGIERLWFGRALSAAVGWRSHTLSLQALDLKENPRLELAELDLRLGASTHLQQEVLSFHGRKMAGRRRGSKRAALWIVGKELSPLGGRLGLHTLVANVQRILVLPSQFQGQTILAKGVVSKDDRVRADFERGRKANLADLLSLFGLRRGGGPQRKASRFLLLGHAVVVTDRPGLEFFLGCPHSDRGRRRRWESWIDLVFLVDGFGGFIKIHRTVERQAIGMVKGRRPARVGHGSCRRFNCQHFVQFVLKKVLFRSCEDKKEVLSTRKITSNAFDFLDRVCFCDWCNCNNTWIAKFLNKPRKRTFNTYWYAAVSEFVRTVQWFRATKTHPYTWNA